MKTLYDDAMTMREARQRYFDVNGFGSDGGYEDAWVDFHIGPLPLPFPNTQGRIRALAHHDAHHLLTGYETNATGEFEIAAWEIGAGTKDYYAAWWLNLGGVAAGVLSSPRRVFRSFVKGRRERSTYGEGVDALLDLTVAEARARFTPYTGKTAPAATITDVALFAVTAIAGMTVGGISLVIGLPLVPVGLTMNIFKRRSENQAFATTSARAFGRGASSSTPTR